MPRGNGSSVRERAASGVDPQDGMFDHQWTDAELEAALEEREQLRTRKRDVTSEFKTSDTAVREALGRFELAVGEVARIGRFRIKKTRTEATDVEFTRGGKERLGIKALDV